MPSPTYCGQVFVTNTKMQRTFEELGVNIEGFSSATSGEAEFDQAGDVVNITIEPSGADSASLVLDISKLVPERIALRRKYGSSFLAVGGAVRSHARQYELFMALSETIKKAYATTSKTTSLMFVIARVSMLPRSYCPHIRKDLPDGQPDRREPSVKKRRVCATPFSGLTAAKPG